MKIAAIIVAAGQGQRAGPTTPKQLREVAGKPVFAWSVEAFDQSPDISQIILVVPAGTETEYQIDCATPLQIVAGGESRTSSVKAGLEAAALHKNDIVMIHDAARPGLTDSTITMLIDAIEHYDAAAPALTVADALKKQDKDKQICEAVVT